MDEIKCPVCGRPSHVSPCRVPGAKEDEERLKARGCPVLNQQR
jgi:hypothetical protein